MTEPVRIAMWSGPRNISTAMMRAWENRPDTVVVDEPFYGFYLRETGIDHPGRDEVLASCEADWRRVAARLTTAPVADGATIFFQKHMTHHLLPDIDRGALAGLRHAFLIRDPRDMLISYARVRAEPTLDDLGLPRQVELYRHFGGPVLDAGDVLESPEPMLRQLCGALGVPFSNAMLSWPAGTRATDGVWARYWYDAVQRSTGFAAYRPKSKPLPARLEPLLETCRPYYDELHAQRVRP